LESPDEGPINHRLEGATWTAWLENGTFDDINRNDIRDSAQELNYSFRAVNELYELEQLSDENPTQTSIYIYYGAADKYIAAVSLNLKGLLNELIKSKSL